MSKRIFSITLVFALGISLAGAFAQSDPAGSNLLAQATSLSRGIQEEALVRIQSMVGSGALPASSMPVVYEALGALALSGFGNPAIEGMTVVNSYPMIRMGACRELGRVGGASARRILVQVLLDDNEPMVLAEAAYQLGKIASDDNDVRAIVYAFRREDALRPQNNLAYATLTAFDAIAKRERGIRFASVFDVITRIEQSDYTYTVKAKASQVLQNLRSYN